MADGELIRATWQGATIAESADTVVVEGNHYFPIASVDGDYLCESATTSVCPWKGTASYYTLEVGDFVNEDAAWFYPDPKPEAEQVRDRVAFWKGVEVGPA